MKLRRGNKHHINLMFVVIKHRFTSVKVNHGVISTKETSLVKY